jgi:hypothetical protein
MTTSNTHDHFMNIMDLNNYGFIMEQRNDSHMTAILGIPHLRFLAAASFAVASLTRSSTRCIEF